MADATKAQRLTLVLLPGMDGTGDLFVGFMDALPEAFEIVRVRYPTDRCLSYSELDKLVQAACSVSGPLVLVAESFSTPLAIKYAASNPKGLKGIVLCAGFAASPVQGWRRFLGSLLAMLVFRIPLPGLAARLWLLGWNAPVPLVAAVQRAARSVRPKVLAARLQAVLECDVRMELGQTTVPVLYLQAKQDHLVNASCLAAIQQSKPNVAVAELDGPHLLLQRNPLRAAQVIGEFVRHTLEDALPAASG